MGVLNTKLTNFKFLIKIVIKYLYEDKKYACYKMKIYSKTTYYKNR